ncbi:MerR family transcriptional regulator [Amycolatopsis sp. cg5]|uniref:MerR family transcriptional regulator n=1 Tax=Amycolatopsis sp. cg5 TaxID=3238802 RepID=UPI003524F7F7
MRMAELSSVSGIPVATIKYYLREGLLQPGERTSPNQARYGEAHVRRLKLVRALIDVGGLSIAAVQETLGAIDDQVSTHSALGFAQKGIAMPDVVVDDETRDWALGLIKGVAEEHGWDLCSEDPAIEVLISVMGAFRDLGHEYMLDGLPQYAKASRQIAEQDLASLAGMQSVEQIVESAAVGTVLGDTLLMALRRLAQQEVSHRVYGD